ncbi:MAG: YbjN domain-containing protein [Rikenellaceae bacterium]
MKPVLKKIKKIFKEKGLSYEIDEELNLIYFRIFGADVPILVEIRLQYDDLLFISAGLEFEIPQSFYSEVLDVINDINGSALIATLFLNKRESCGEVLAQSSLFTIDEKLDKEAFYRTLFSTIEIANSNSTVIMEEVFDDDAIAKIREKKCAEESQNE